MYRPYKHFKIVTILVICLAVVKGSRSDEYNFKLQDTSCMHSEYIAEHEIIDFNKLENMQKNHTDPLYAYKHIDLAYCIANPKLKSIRKETPKENFILIKNISPLDKKEHNKLEIDLIRAWNVETFTMASLVSVQYTELKIDGKSMKRYVVSPLSPLNSKYTILLMPSSTYKKNKKSSGIKSVAECSTASLAYMFVKKCLNVVFCSLFMDKIAEAQNISLIGANKFVLEPHVQEILENSYQNHFLNEEPFYIVLSRLRRYNMHKKIQEIKELFEEDKEESNKVYSKVILFNGTSEVTLLEILEKETKSIDFLLNFMLENSSNLTESATTKENIRKEHIWVIDLLVENLFGSIGIETDLKEKKKNHIVFILDDIEKHLAEQEDGQEKAIEAKKQDIIRIISIRIPGLIESSAKNSIERINKKKSLLLDLMISKLVDYSFYKKIGSLEDIFKKEKASLEEQCTNNMFESILDLNTGLKHITQNKCALSVLLDVLKDIFNVNSDGRWHVKKEKITYTTLQSAYRAVEEVCVLEQLVRTFNSCNEVWEDLVFLYSIANETVDGKDQYFICYTSDKDNKIYRKEIDGTEENIRRFKNAKTLQEIECINESCEVVLNFDSGIPQVK